MQANLGARILVIDDCELTHNLIASRLGIEGATLYRALDPHEGLALANAVRPDVVLLDVEMTSMSGFEVCERLLEGPPGDAPKVIFLSGDPTIEAKVRGLEVGAVDYVTKPFDVMELRARVRAALRSRRNLARLVEHAQIDGLTGLWNRAHFDTRLAEGVAGVQRYGHMLSLVLIDVDYFKKINDTYGHPKGDEVLRAISEALKEATRKTDLACRYGGEEFAVILSETDDTTARQAAERIREALQTLLFRHGDATFGVTASMGVAAASEFPHGTISTSGLLAAADAALYQAKHGGRDRICSSRPPRPPIRRVSGQLRAVS